MSEISDYFIIDGELYHYGVKGMKWGVRRNQTGSSKSFADKTINDISKSQIEKGQRAADNALRGLPINLQLFAKKNRKARPMPKVISELMTHATVEQRNSAMYVTDIGNYTYTVMNQPGDTPIVINKRKNDGLTRNKRGDKK